MCPPGIEPVEINSGDDFLIEVEGQPELKITRMEFWHFGGPLKGREYRDGPGEYYSVDGYHLRRVFALPLASSGIKPNRRESDKARCLLGLGVRLVLSMLAGHSAAGLGAPLSFGR